MPPPSGAGDDAQKSSIPQRLAENDEQHHARMLVLFQATCS